ncbi:hypothetical protein [Enterobacter asburiae]
MSTHTKEQLIARINQVTAINKYRIGRDPAADGLTMDNELFAIALASLEADAVAYVDPFAFHNFSVYRAGETDNKRMGREWMWANPDAGLIPVYTAPPAPVSVPDFSALDRLAGEMLTHAMNCERRVSVAYTHCAHRLAEEVRDLRAAMLQGADGTLTNEGTIPANVACNLRDAVDAIRNSGIAIDGEKILAERDALNSPEIPDDVRRMDWLVSKTVDVREPMVYGSHSLFWSQTITDEEDEYHATKLREQIDAAMEAEQAAAPQQEAKNV